MQLPTFCTAHLLPPSPTPPPSEEASHTMSLTDFPAKHQDVESLCHRPPSDPASFFKLSSKSTRGSFPHGRPQWSSMSLSFYMGHCGGSAENDLIPVELRQPSSEAEMGFFYFYFFISWSGFKCSPVMTASCHRLPDIVANDSPVKYITWSETSPLVSHLIHIVIELLVARFFHYSPKVAHCTSTLSLFSVISKSMVPCNSCQVFEAQDHRICIIIVWLLSQTNSGLSRVPTNRVCHDRYMFLIRGRLENESRADREERKEEMERKSGASVIKGRLEMKGGSAWV